MRINLSCHKRLTTIYKPVNKISDNIAPNKQWQTFAPLQKDFFNSNFINFTGINRSPENFEVKKVYGLECPCCGQVMLTKKQINAFVSRISEKRGHDLRKELLKESEYYRQNERTIARILTKMSVDNPTLDLKGLVSLKKESSIKRLDRTQKRIFQSIKQQADTLPEEQKEKLLELIDEAIESIDNSSDEMFFKRKDFIKKLTAIKESSKNSEPEFDKIIQIAETIPSSHTSSDAFFVKYSRRENKEIAARLVLPSLITTEHVRPQSHDGADNTENYIPLCGECNSKRGNMPYNLWFEEHPEMPENLQKFVNEIDRLIKNGEFQGFEYYDTYVEEIIEAIKEATEGTLVLKPPKNEEDEEEETDISQETAEESIEEKRERWLSEHDKKREALTVLQEKRQALKDDSEYLMIVRYTHLSKELKEVKAQKNAKQSEISIKHRRLHSKQEALKKQEKENAEEAVLNELRKAIASLEGEAMALEDENKVLISRSINLSEQIDQIKQHIETPGEIQIKIIRLKKRLDELQRIKTEIRNIKQTTKDECDLIIEAAHLNSEIEDRKQANARLFETLDFEDDKNKKALSSYYLLKAQMEMIETVDMKAFRNSFSQKTPAPDFILEDSKKAIAEKMEELLRYSVVQYAKEKDAIEELSAKKKEIQAQLKEYDALKAKALKLQQEARQIKNGRSESALRNDLETLLQKKIRTNEKFQLVDIDEKINKLENECNNLLQKYAESFET